MIRQLHLLICAALAALALAAPTRTLSKRSFKAAAKGHGKLSPLKEVLRTSRKYGLDTPWTEIIILGWGDGNDGTDEMPASASLQLPAPFSTLATSVSIPAASSTESPVASPTELPTYGNGSTTPTQSAEDGEVTATPEQNESEYLSPVTVGGQNLNLNFDSGSADLWVFSSKLPRSAIGSHAVFDPAKSPHWQQLDGAVWNITYGDGSGAQGTVGYDTVDVGGSTVQKQCVEIADYVTDQFVEDANSDGLLGLAFSNINTVLPVPQKTFFENVMDDLTLPVFTADLEETDGTGTYEFGTIDTAKYKGAIHYTSVDKSQGYWTIDLPSFAINGKRSSCNGCWGFPDTGTSLLYLNRDFVADYYDQVASAAYGYPGGYTYDCDEKLPDLSIEIGGYPATIKGSDLTYQKLGNGLCFGGLQTLDQPCRRSRCPPPREMQILGDIFLKQFFAVFDGGNVRFGVAEKN